MNKALKYLLWAIVGGIILFYWFKIRAAQRLVFSIGLPTKFSPKGGELSFIQNINVTNADALNISINGVDLDVYYGKTILGKATISENISIEGNSDTILPVRVAIPFYQLFNVIPDIKTTISTKIVRLAFEGRISAEGISIPYDQEFTVTIPKLW